MKLTFEEKIEFVKHHYEEKGYRVHSGLQFGAELVLYADRPDLVHSDFCIHVARDGKFVIIIADWHRCFGFDVKETYSSTSDTSCSLIHDFSDDTIDWREMQTLARSMPDLHKTLVLANVKAKDNDIPYVEELAITTEHAPFRHRQKSIEIGGQRKTTKKAKLEK